MGNKVNNLFDPAQLRLSQDFATNLGVKKALLTVPVRKPDKQSFFRVRPDEGFVLQTAVLEMKDDRETYLVDRSLWSELAAEITAKAIFTCMNRQNVLFLWPIRLPGLDGKLDEWNKSALEAAHRAKDRWIRVTANMSLGAYEVYEAGAGMPEPIWPDVEFPKLLEIAFRDRYIKTLDHPIIRRLRGL